MRNLRLLAAGAAAAAALVAAPAGADAAVTCDLSSGVLDVSLGASGDVATIEADNGMIRLPSDGGTTLTCTGGTPTTSNTNAISVHNAPGLTDNVVGIFNANEFAPGLSDEAGDNEIEIFVNLNDGANTVLLVGISESPSRLVFGANGINTNAADSEDQPDRDIAHNDSAQLIGAIGSPGSDSLDAQGGHGTGGPLTRGISFSGGEGNDQVIGGDGSDALDGSDGDDVVAGFAGDDRIFGGGGSAGGTLAGGDGNDSIFPGSATDAVDGGAGEDVLHYDGLASGVSVSLEGTDAEHVFGTRFDDVLRGDDGPNKIVGLEGNDQIDGGGGADDVDAGAGDDALQLRDGEADRADCGAGAGDIVTADQLGVDLLTDCNTVIFPPSGEAGDPGSPGGGSSGGGAPGGGAGPAAPAAFGPRTLVTITLADRRIPATGPLAVRLANANGFTVNGTLSGRAARSLSPAQRKRSTRLATKSFTVPANARRTVKLTRPKALRRQLARRRMLSLRMTATVRDPAGNARTVTKTLRPRARARTNNGRIASACVLIPARQNPSPARRRSACR